MVFPHGGRYTMYQNSGDGRFMAETMMMKELVPHIDVTYRTISYRKAVCIDGFSMGKRGRDMTPLISPYAIPASPARSLTRSGTSITSPMPRRLPMPT